ncbi:hypothetical protein [Sphaerothrix gracilis]|uniref:sunset domain-containing protein n=1 Tax=Sphaerothrix gracilis TaxID=3151835 RepID=UPI0031FE10F8
MAHRTSKPKSQAKPQKLSAIAGLGIGLIGAVVFFTDISNRLSPITSNRPSPTTAITKPNCNIKGNISIANGNKNYHLPGMEDYDSTRIQAKHGERWFCSESEAIAAGWRKAPK